MDDESSVSKLAVTTLFSLLDEVDKIYEHQQYDQNTPWILENKSDTLLLFDIICSSMPNSIHT